MKRSFKTADYEATLDVQVRLGDCLPPDHLARFVVDTIAHLDLTAIYGRYGPRGGQPYAPEILLGLLFYGYATGVFSSRKIERATSESIPFRFIAGNLHPDHDTLASFRASFLPEIKDLVVQILLLAQVAGALKLGTISLDGTKVHADASKSRAVSYKRLREQEARLRAEVEALFALSEQADQTPPPDGLLVEHEIALRQERLARLAQAKAVLETRAAERDAHQAAEYAAKVQDREERARRKGRKPGGRPPKPPSPGPRDKDQYTFTDPESRIMKNSSDDGFDQSFNAQVAVDQASLLIVGHSLSNHPIDQHELPPTLASIRPELRRVQAAALDAGYFSAANVAWCEGEGIEPYIAPGRASHQQTLAERLAAVPEAPAADAAPKVQMAFKLKTALGAAIYRARKSTVEPVIGSIKEAMGFRQFSLRGEQAAAGEWCLVCLAFNLRRFHTLLQG